MLFLRSQQGPLRSVSNYWADWLMLNPDSSPGHRGGALAAIVSIVKLNSLLKGEAK